MEVPRYTRVGSCLDKRRHTLHRAFLQGKHALRVTVSGTLLRFKGAEAVTLPSDEFPWPRRKSDPVVDSEVIGVTVLGVLDDPLGSLCGRRGRYVLLEPVLDMAGRL